MQISDITTGGLSSCIRELRQPSLKLLNKAMASGDCGKTRRKRALGVSTENRDNQVSEAIYLLPGSDGSRNTKPEFSCTRADGASSHANPGPESPGAEPRKLFIHAAAIVGSTPRLTFFAAVDFLSPRPQNGARQPDAVPDC